MKKILSIALCIVLCLSFCSCVDDNDKTKEPVKTPTITRGEYTIPTPPSFNYDFEIETRPKQGRTVYVSKSGKKIHRIPNCSGMKNYWEMSYEDAVEAGYKFCQNCY